jgi:16S rRNA (uracil1498-N3)-methyltransferase
MHERRFLVPEIAQAPEIEIRGDEAHHLLHVLRLREGDEITLFDGEGHHFRAVITRCSEESAEVERLEALPSNESHLELRIAVAIPKGDKMATLIRMLTELGIHRLIPLVSERTVVGSPSANRKKVPRWERIAMEACKQSGRSRIPKVEEPVLFEELLNEELPPHRLLLCPNGDDLPKTPSSQSCLALVGPEGGWTRDEMARAEEKGFHTLGLGQRILRVETAAVTLAAILQEKWGDLRSSHQTSDISHRPPSCTSGKGLPTSDD